MDPRTILSYQTSTVPPQPMRTVLHIPPQPMGVIDVTAPLRPIINDTVDLILPKVDPSMCTLSMLLVRNEQ